jgi:diguanylate cyclase (GGDEF)-like protein
MNLPPSTVAAPDWAVQVEHALHVSDFTAARRLAEQAHACAADDPARALAVFLAARGEFVSGATEEGLRHALTAAALYESLGDLGGHAKSCALAARCLLKSGDAGSALDHGLVALRSAAQAEPDRPSPALLAALLSLGIVYRGLGQLDTARDYCQQALDCAIALPDRVTQGAAIDTLACVHSSVAAAARAEGRGEEAEQHEREAMRCSAQAIQIAREQGHLRYEATAVNNLAESMSHVGEALAALRLLEDWARDNPCELPRVRVNQLETRGRLCLALGQAPRARELFELALAAGPDADLEINITACLASACETLGDHRAALGHFRRFHALHVQLAAAAAQRSARIAAVRLDTERQRERTVALELDNAKLQQHADALFRQSTEDPLTGLANRRRLDQLLRAGHVSHAALMVDIDHFKTVNDRYSHAVGDAVLCRLAALLTEGSRSIDTAVRLGGEEFLVLLPQAPAAAAAVAAERLRARIEAFDWTVLAPGLAVTASIGVALGGEAGSVEGLLALADQRLYAAKRSGRNCVVSA